MQATISNEATVNSPQIWAEYEDVDLVKASQGGVLAAFDELIQRYQQRVYATVYHMTSSHEDADDLTQESFIKAYKALKRFKGESSFYTWIYRIAVNRTINFLKQRKRKSYHMSLNDMDLQVEKQADLLVFISDKTPRRDVRLNHM